MFLVGFDVFRSEIYSWKSEEKHTDYLKSVDVTFLDDDWLPADLLYDRPQVRHLLGVGDRDERAAQGRVHALQKLFLLPEHNSHVCYRHVSLRRKCVYKSAWKHKCLHNNMYSYCWTQLKLLICNKGWIGIFIQELSFFFFLFLALGGGFPLCPEILQYTQWLCLSSEFFHYEMPDSNPGPLLQ